MHPNDRRAGDSNRTSTPSPKRRPRRSAQAAPAHRPAQSALPTPAATPVTVESVLTQLVAELTATAVESIAPDASAIENGIDSLAALQLQHRLAAVTGARLPLASLLGAATLREAGAEWHQLADAAAGAAADAAPLQPLPISTPRWQHWHLMDALQGPCDGHHSALLLRLEGKLHRPALDQALQALLARHAALRAVTAEAAHADLLPTALAGDSAEACAASLDAAVHEALRRPFDLRRGTLLRATLWRLAEARHALLLVAHRMACDATGLAILASELGTLYAAFSAAERPRLPPLRPAHAERDVDATDAIVQSQLIAHWRRRLAGQPALDLPRDHGPDGALPRRMASVAMALPPALVASLRTLARRENVTLFVLLLAAYKLLLMRLSGQTDLCVLVPMSARRGAESTRSVGDLSHAVPLRTDLSGQPGFRQLLARVRETTLQGIEHMAVPTPWLLCAPGRTGPARDRSLAQAGFALEPSLATPRFRGLRVQASAVRGAIPGMALDLVLTEAGATLRAELAYDAAAFDAATAQRWLLQYQRLLEHLVADPGQPITACDIVGTADRQLVVHDWNRSAKPYPRETRIDELVTLQARRTPNAVAVGMGVRSLRYAELEAGAQGLAQQLARRGVAAGQRVGLCLQPTPELLLALLAVMKSGAAFVVLDPAWSRERLAFVVGDAGLALVLTQGDTARLLPALPDRLLDIDQAWRESPPRSDSTPAAPATTDHLACLAYTWGETGRPRGIEVAHRGLTNGVWAMRQAPGCGADDVLLSLAAPSATGALLEYFLPLIIGARLELASREEAGQPALLLRRLQACKPTLMQATPTLWRRLVDAGWNGNRKLVALSGGEPLPRELAARLVGRVAALWNLYGAAESSGWCLAARVLPGEGRVGIGRPIANARAYIVDEAHRPVAIGMPGQLCIGGDAVARGVRGEPEAGAARFVADPFSDDPESRLHATGDLARQRVDGQIELLGRLRTQLRVAGVRVVPGDVEAALLRHPQVRQAVVDVRAEAGGAQRLVAWVQRHGAVGAQAAQLRDFLRNRLPEAMLPAHFVFVETLPLTPQATLDKAALPAPADGPDAAAGPRTTPRSTLEFQLLVDWRQALDSDAVGIDGDFFFHGGNALQAQQLLARVASWSRRGLSLAELFQAPTVAAMARHLSRSGWAPPWQAMVALQASGAAPPLFLVAPVDGDALQFTGLARALGDGQPCYGLQLQGQATHGRAVTSVTAMAARCVGEIRSVHTSGSCCVAGVGNGGIVAVEVAQQLRAQGVDVRLALLDDGSSRPRPANARPGATWPLRLQRAASAWWQGLRGGRHDAAAGGAGHAVPALPTLEPQVRDDMLRALQAHRPRPSALPLLQVPAAREPSDTARLLTDFMRQSSTMHPGEPTPLLAAMSGPAP